MFRYYPILILFVLFVCPFTGCFQRQDACIYVDNNTKESMTVEIDGKRVAYVSANKIHRIKRVKLGEHQITVRSNGEVIFDEVKNIEALDGGSVWQNRYVLNPSGTSRYWAYKMKYEFNEEVEIKTADSVPQMCDDYDLLASTQWLEAPKDVKLFPSMLLMGGLKGDTSQVTILDRVSEEDYCQLRDVKYSDAYTTTHDLSRLIKRNMLELTKK
jgi:hypothetical protein